MHDLQLSSGVSVPLLGQGTWMMGRDSRERGAEVAALRRGLELGMTVIDTAEMYDDAERVVAEVLEGRRDEIYLVSKVLPQNASRAGTMAAAERSLRRLKTDHLDLYLLHWSGPHPLEETLAAFQELREQGKVRAYGVSNFDAAELRQARQLDPQVEADQVLYNLTRRGAEWDLLPRCQEEQVLFMAYSPLEQARLGTTGALQEVAVRHGVTPYQVALAWVLHQPGVMAIPKATRLEHVEQNAAAGRLRLTREDLAALDRAYPGPTGPTALETL